MAVAAEMPRLRIGWLIVRPIIGSGGFQTIFEIINLLAKFGHDNVVYMNPDGLPAEFVDRPEHFISRHFGPLFASVRRWPDVIDQVDIALATEWGSFGLLGRCAPRVARAYFVQDFEPFFLPMSYEYLKAEATYRAGTPCVTIGHWLATFLRDQYGATTYPFDFAVDHSTYRLRPDLGGTRRRITFYARPSTPRRCFDLGVEALKLVHQRHPDAEIVLFGDRQLGQLRLPFPFEDRGIISPEQLAELYASSTVGVVLSPTNPSRTPPEMMAAGCAVVDLDLPPNHFLIDHEQTGLLAAPEPEALADAICRLLEDEALHARLVAQARAAVEPLSWAHSARQVEAALLEIAPPKHVPASVQLDLDQSAGEGTTPALSERLVVGQRCLPRHDGLCRIAVGMSAPGGETPTLRIYDATRPDSLLLESSSAQHADSWLVYEFPPISATRHRALYFTFAAAAGPQLRFTYRPLAGESLAYNDVPQAGQLMYRAWYRPSLGTAADDRPAQPDDELAYLYVRQRMATAEQELLSAYLAKLQQVAAPNGGRSLKQRGGYALQLLRRGAWRRLLNEGGAYLRWLRAAAASRDKQR